MRAVRHLAEDIAKAHAETDAFAAKVLARALSALVSGAGEAGDATEVIDLAAERKKRL